MRQKILRNFSSKIVRKNATSFQRKNTVLIEYLFLVDVIFNINISNSGNGNGSNNGNGNALFNNIAGVITFFSDLVNVVMLQGWTLLG